MPGTRTREAGSPSSDSGSPPGTSPMLIGSLPASSSVSVRGRSCTVSGACSRTHAVRASPRRRNISITGRSDDRRPSGSPLASPGSMRTASSAERTAPDSTPTGSTPGSPNCAARPGCAACASTTRATAPRVSCSPPACRWRSSAKDWARPDQRDLGHVHPSRGRAAAGGDDAFGRLLIEDAES